MIDETALMGTSSNGTTDGIKKAPAGLSIKQSMIDFRGALEQEHEQIHLQKGLLYPLQIFSNHQGSTAPFACGADHLFGT
jgi:hypothetical protein